MTTFDQPDSGLLVEHLLPSLIGANHSLSQDLRQRTVFFGELGTALEQLHGRLTVISSPPRGAREPSPYPWLWRYVSHFMVGSNARAIQHAKLWAFHWKSEEGERLDLHVSSTNLTLSAFKSQLQAGWHLSLRLAERATATARRTWGELIPFLEALGASAGPFALQRIQGLVALLGRVECPDDLTFVASIPGRKSAGRKLKAFELSRVHVLAPSIGEWNEGTLNAWCDDVGVAPAKVHLKWISTTHPWAGPGWALSHAASDAISTVANLERLPVQARFSDHHLEGDLRWSHAKLYLLCSRRRRRLLVTSANWSVSAWGAGSTTPRNFELGVAFDSEWTDLERLGEPFAPPDTPYCVDRADEDDRISFLEWAEASWDGKAIRLLVRSTDATAPITAKVSFSDEHEEVVALVNSQASLPWSDLKRMPLAARFEQNLDSLEVDVLDLRLPDEFGQTPLPEVDPEIATALREAFLLQRYGGPAVDVDCIPGLSGARHLSAAAIPADYTVQAWLDARDAFRIVDNWRDARTRAAQDAQTLTRVRMDGDALREVYSRREGVVAALVVEEMTWRMDENV